MFKLAGFDGPVHTDPRPSRLGTGLPTKSTPTWGGTESPEGHVMTSSTSTRTRRQQRQRAVQQAAAAVRQATLRRAIAQMAVADMHASAVRQQNEATIPDWSRYSADDLLRLESTLDER